MIPSRDITLRHILLHPFMLWGGLIIIISLIILHSSVFAPSFVSPQRRFSLFYQAVLSIRVRGLTLVGRRLIRR